MPSTREVWAAATTGNERIRTPRARIPRVQRERIGGCLLGLWEKAAIATMPNRAEFVACKQPPQDCFQPHLLSIRLGVWIPNAKAPSHPWDGARTEHMKKARTSPSRGRILANVGGTLVRRRKPVKSILRRRAAPRSSKWVSDNPG